MSILSKLCGVCVPVVLLGIAAGCSDDGDSSAPSEGPAQVASAETSTAAFQAKLDGPWKLSKAVEVPSPAGTVYRTETVTFAGGKNTVNAEFFGDPNLTQKLFVYTSVGPYTLVGPSKVVEGAWDVNLTNESQTLTLLVDSPQLVAAAGWDDCNLVVGKPVDVLNGCASPPLPPASCQEKDLWQIVGEGATARLRWGDTSVDRCTDRPTRFDPVELVRP